MTNPNQTDLEGMIARIEQANARAYEQFGRADESASKSEQDTARLPAAQPDPPVSSKRQSSRAGPLLVALIGLVIAASACVAAFAWEPSYGDTAKQMIVQWAKPWVFQTAHQAPITPRDGVPAAPLNLPEVAQRLQKMADDLANVEQQIEQLRASQEQIIRSDAAVAEQIKASQEQTLRDNAKVTEQLNAALAQMMRTMRRQDREDASTNPARRR